MNQTVTLQAGDAFVEGLHVGLRLVQDDHEWRSPMVWEAAHAVPGPWAWLSAAPVTRRAAA